MLKNLLFSLAEPGTEGGSGGGGGTPSAPESGLPPLSAASAREKIYDSADSRDAGADAPAEGAQAKPDATPPAKDSAPADGKPKDDGKGKADDAAEKRIKDTQRMAHEKAEEAAKEKKRADEAEAKLKKVGKYVDFDKLEEHDKTEEEKRLDQPLTRRDLKELQETQQPPAEPPTPSLSAEDSEKFLADYYDKNKHVVPYVESGEAYGVFLKTAEKMGPEIAGLSEVEQLTKIGEAVSEHFRQRDAGKEREIAERLNTKRTAISSGGVPPAGMQPRGEEPEDPGDGAHAEFERRQANRARIFNPTL
jgi:hypothetical protein